MLAQNKIVECILFNSLHNSCHIDNVLEVTITLIKLDVIYVHRVAK